MDSNTILAYPQQKLSDKEKDEAWHIQNLKYGITLRYYQNLTVRKSRQNMISNYNLWNGIFDEQELEKVFNTMKLKNYTSPGKHQNYPIEVSKFERLAGEEAKRKFDFFMKVMNEDADSIKEGLEKDKLMASVNEHITSEAFSKEQAQKDLESIGKYFNYDYQDIRAERGTQILKYLWREQEMPIKFNRAFYDILIGAEEVYACDIIGGEPVMRKCDPINTSSLRSGTSNRYEDSDLIVESTFMPPGMVLDTYKEYLKEEDIDHIEKGRTTIKDASATLMYGTYNSQIPNVYTGSDNGMIALNNNAINYFTDYWDINGNVRVTRMVWKSFRKVGKLKFFDENDEEQFDWVPETYKANKKTGEEVTWLWIPEWREGTQVADRIYIKMQVYPVNIYDMDSLRLKTSPYIGTIYNINNSKAISLMDRIKPYKFLYNTYHRRLDMAMAKWNPMTELDLAKKPEHWDLDKWLTYAQTHGYLIIDSFAESSKARFKGQAAGGFNTTGKVLQVELGNFIQQVITILQYIERQISLVSGISPEREGQGTTSNTLGGQQALEQNSAYITEQYYNIHDNTKIRVLQNMLEVSKVAWKGRKKKLPYILDNMTMQILDVDGDVHAETNYNLFVSNSSDDTTLFNVLKGLAPHALQNDKANLSQIMDMYMSNSIQGVRRSIEKAEQDKFQRDASAQQQQAKDMQEQRALQLQLHKETMSLEQYKVDVAAQTKITVAQIGTYNRQLELDQDGDGIPDPLQVGKLALDEQKHQSEKEIKEREISLKEKEIKSKEGIEKLKSETAIKIAKENKTSFELKSKKKK